MVAASTRYRTVRARIEDGDLLLFRRPKSFISRMTGGPYSHSAMAIWRGDVLLLAESREWYGARLVTLSSQVRKCPRVIDVFRPLVKHEVAVEAADLMVRQAGHEYGYAAIMGYSLFKIFGRGRPPYLGAVEPEWGTPKFCSAQTTWCYRRAAERREVHFDPKPGVPSEFVTPNDQAQSAAFEMKFQGLFI